MAKICQRGYEMVQVCRDNGTVRPCGWVSVTDIGNLSENSMEEIMHGEKAEDFRQSLLDGSFRYCDPDSCPFLANNKLQEVEYQGVPDYPKEIYLAYDHTCNYNCTSCRKGDNLLFGKTQNRDFEKIEKEIQKFINKVSTISANGLGELFATPSIMKVLADWKPECENPSVILETNGSLFNKENWKKIENLGQYYLDVIVTVMSFEDAAYKLLSGVNYDTTKIVENLSFISELRQKGIINHFEIATVFQERNFRTLPEFARRSIEEFKADRVRLRPFFQLGADTPENEWFYDIRNEYHPYYKEFEEIMKDPIFNHPKVFHWSGHDMPAPRRHPGERNFQNYDILKRLFWDDNFTLKLSKYMEEENLQKIAVYGLGGIGKAVVSLLDAGGIQTGTLIDIHSGECEYRQKEILHCLDDVQPNSDSLVIVALPEMDCDGAIKTLKETGFSNVMGISDLLCKVNEDRC